MSDPIEIVVQRLEKDLAYISSGRVVSFSGASKLRMQTDLETVLRVLKERPPTPQPRVQTSAVKPGRPRNELLDTLALIDGQKLSEMTPVAWSKMAAALKQIRAVMPGVTPMELQRRAANYRRKWPDRELTATALASWWGSVGDSIMGGFVDHRVPDNLRK